ncbi:MAG: twin transmembrane helix small protein [Alphaproteobacteria bacterium]|nr:twin transmembrane helix small protein [Alphaproteobacteria bacterium]
MVAMGVTLAAVVVALALGLFTMARGGAFNARYGNKLMRARVLLQALAILLLAAIFWLNQQGG